MCDSLFQKGYYFRPGDDPADATAKLGPLEGTLSHIHFVKARRDRDPKVNKLAKAAGEFQPPRAPDELYRKFLFYKYFAAPVAPLIVSEEFSDITYLQCAIRALVKKFPLLAKEENGKAVRLVHFLKSSGTSRDLLNLGHGAAGQGALISQYENVLKKYRHKPMAHPVIILCDNDDGAQTRDQERQTQDWRDGVNYNDRSVYDLGVESYIW